MGATEGRKGDVRVASRPRLPGVPALLEQLVTPDGHGAADAGAWRPAFEHRDGGLALDRMNLSP